MSPRFALITIFVIDVFIFGLLIWAVRGVHGAYNPEFSLTFVIGLLGVVCGWLLGFLASPKKDEVQRFSNYAGLMSSFITGYLMSKLDPVISEAITVKMFNEPIPFLRLLVFLICFIAGLLMMYVYRAYGRDYQEWAIKVPTKQPQSTK